MDVDTIAAWEIEIAKWEIEHARAAEVHAKRFRQAAKSRKDLTLKDREHLRHAADLVLTRARLRARRTKETWAQLTRQREG